MEDDHGEYRYGRTWAGEVGLQNMPAESDYIAGYALPGTMPLLGPPGRGELLAALPGSWKSGLLLSSTSLRFTGRRGGGPP